MKLYRRLFWPDTHAPYHDVKAVEVALMIGKEHAPQELVIEGDFFDIYCISDYEQDPLKACRVLEEEICEARELLFRIVTELNPEKVIFIEGNHEDRITRYLRRHAPKLMGIVSSRSILGIPKNYVWVPWGPKNKYQAGKLTVTHGTKANKHCAAGMAEKFGESVLFGHTHRLQEFTRRTASGRLILGATNGWLGDQDRAAEYVVDVADWSHAVTAGWFKPGGDFWLQTVRIEKHEAVFNGKFFRA
jgi:predicted phosphodiesterase